MGANVDIKMTFLARLVRAKFTLEWFGASVNGGMLYQIVLSHSGIVADITLENPGVVLIFLHMNLKNFPARTSVGTTLTLKWPLLVMGTQVDFKVHLLKGRVVTQMTFVRLEPFVHPHMDHHQTTAFSREATNFTVVWTLSHVDKCMAHDPTVVWGCEVAKITFIDPLFISMERVGVFPGKCLTLCVVIYLFSTVRQFIDR